jgi:hypothetical protein
MSTYDILSEDDDVTIVTSNMASLPSQPKLHPVNHAYAAMMTSMDDAIADSGATQIFIMEGTPMHNKQGTTCPLKVMLADGRHIMSTHMCDVNIPGLPITLTGHINPDLSIALLFGIRVLTDMGCTVVFNKDKCIIYFKGLEILKGYKDPSTNLWTLTLGRSTAQHDPVMPVLACPNLTSSRTCPSQGTVTTMPHVVCFTHTVHSKANSMKFSHQSLCSPAPINPTQSHQMWLPQRVPQSNLHRHHLISKSKPRLG